MSIVDLLFIQKLPEKIKARARSGEIIYLLEDTKPGWSGSLPFYLFACINEDCVNHHRLAMDYPHGFENHNKRLICPECRTNKFFPTTEPPFWEKIRLLFRMRKLIKEMRNSPKLLK